MRAKCTYSAHRFLLRVRRRVHRRRLCLLFRRLHWILSRTRIGTLSLKRVYLKSGAEVTGECTEWASGNNYGTMPNWDTSLVTDMSGWGSNKIQGFRVSSAFDGNISKWDTGQVTSMSCLIPLLRSTNPLGVGTQRK